MFEDLAPFFADFGEVGQLAGQAVRGIFERSHEVQLSGGGIVNGAPSFRLPTSSVPVSPFGALLVLTGPLSAGTWRVAEHQPDGTGVSVLILERA